jgi:hypothetical protein
MLEGVARVVEASRNHKEVKGVYVWQRIHFLFVRIAASERRKIESGSSYKFFGV